MAASVALPPGFRFHPTDEELVGYYLHRKAGGLEIELEVIPVLDLYKFEPWQLPEKSFLPQGDMEWFFFCPRDRKYPNGSRTNRATKTGYWKATGKDRRVVCPFSVTGFRKTLVFHLGRAPVGDRTEWVMHEYRICDESFPHSSTSPGAFALCRVMRKNDIAQKNDNQRGKHSSHMGFDELSSIITDKSYSTSDYTNGKEHKVASPPPAPIQGGERPLWASPYMQELVYNGESEGRYLEQSTFPCSEMTTEMNVAAQVECWDDFRGLGYTSWCQTDKESLNLCENGGLLGKNTWRY